MTYTVVGIDMDEVDTWYIVVEADSPHEAVAKAAADLRSDQDVPMHDVVAHFVFEGKKCDLDEEQVREYFPEYYD